MSGGGLHRLQSMLNQLSASERKIAEYILAHPEKAIHMTATELGKYTQTSGATVVRLSKSLQLNGFQDLKMKIAGDLAKPVDQGYRDIKPKEPMDLIIQKITSNTIQSLRDTVEIIEQKELKKAVQVLLQAKNVHFFGIGASHIIALDAQQKWLRINRGATAFADAHLVATQIANAEQNDVVFAISFSGETPEVIKILRLAKMNGVRTISLTKYGSSAVANLAETRLHTSFSAEAPFRSGATSSRIAQLHIIDILFLAIASTRYDQIVESLDKTRKATRWLKENN
ncbi:MAG: MurR/RpiR family transcriptional regulator [Thermoactinomyces sp.]